MQTSISLLNYNVKHWRTNSNGCPVQQNKPIGKLMSRTAIPCVCQSTKKVAEGRNRPLAGGVRMENSKRSGDEKVK